MPSNDRSPGHLVVEGLQKDYVSGKTATPIVKGVSFQIEPGNFYSLLGPSGCGKTTTLRCVAGLETATGGQIRLDDRVLSGPGTHATPDRRDIGMVFQNYAIWPHLSVFDNAAFPLRVERPRLSRSEIESRVHEALALVRLKDMSDRFASAMSGGQQQRLALARALVRQPSLLLLDEPLSNLDAQLRDEMRVEVRELQQRLGITTLFVTHDQAEALSMSDRVAVMRDGVIEQEGTPQEIYHSPASSFVAGFVGRANIVSGDIIENMGDDVMRVSVLGSSLLTKCNGNRVGDKVRLSIRAESIRAHDQQPDRTNVVEGQVHKVEFLGQFVECQVKVGGSVVHIRQSPLSSTRPGDRVFLEVPMESCTVLAADGS